MKDYERIDYLIKRLEGDNARRFSEVTGIPTASLSRARHGYSKPSLCYDKILATYPQVRKKWLYTGEGEPIKGDNAKDEISRRLDLIEAKLEKILAELSSKNSSKKS